MIGTRKIPKLWNLQARETLDLTVLTKSRSARHKCDLEMQRRQTYDATPVNMEDYNDSLQNPSKKVADETKLENAQRWPVSHVIPEHAY